MHLILSQDMLKNEKMNWNLRGKDQIKELMEDIYSAC